MKGDTLIFTALLVVFFSSSFARAESQWIEKAKAEGEVMVYGTSNIADMRDIIANFEKKFPFLKINYYRAGGEKLAHKIVTEVRAGRHVADAYQISGAEMFLLKKRGFLGHYESPERKFVRDIYKDNDGYWTGMFANLEFIGYNKTLVSAVEAPKSHKDLLDPKWKQKIALDRTDIEWYITQIHLLGKAQAREFMQKFARQDIQVRRGHTLLAQLLAAGEFSLLMTLRDHTAYTLTQQGAPLDWVAIEPVIPNPPVSIALPKQPPHPNAGRLWIDYILSREGQNLVKESGRNVTREDVDHLVARVRQLKLGKIDWVPYIEDYRTYEAEFRELFLRAQ